jgi:hypothetical protein
MNLFGFDIADSTIKEGIVYLLDPGNRILAIGIGIIFILFIAKFLFRSIKRLLLIAVIIGVVVYLGMHFLINGA